MVSCGDAGASGSTTTGGAGGGGNGGSGATMGEAGGTSSGTAGQGGTTSGAGGTGGTPASVCPPGSESLVLDLSGVTVTVVPGVPPSDGFSPGFAILEGPLWLDGALLLSQISTSAEPPPSRILRLAPGGNAEVLFPDAGTNGLAVGPDGALFGGVHKDGSISRFDPLDPGASPVVIAGAYMGNRFNSPNDLAIRSDGNIYFSDPDWQSPKPNPQPAERAYRVAPGGQVTPFGEYTENGSTQSVQKPNGVALRKDETALFLGGQNGLFEMPIAADGTVSTGSRVSAVNGGVDGLGVDCAGNLYVTNGQSVVVLDPGNAVIGAIAVNAQVTNVAFGGPGGKTLYITTLGNDPKLYQAELDVPGYPY